MGNCFSSERVPNTESSDHILQPFHQTQVTLHGEAGQVVTQHVHGVPVVQDVPIVAHRPLPDPLEAQLGKLCQTSGNIMSSDLTSQGSQLKGFSPQM